MNEIVKDLTTDDTVTTLVERQRTFFRSGSTRELGFRKEQLKRLRNAITRGEADIIEAVRQDLGRPTSEIWTTEIGIVLAEIKHALRHLSSWARPKRVGTPLLLQPGSSRIEYEPLGTVLIIAPWNYPFLLAVAPLVAALAAGNTAIIKPSEQAPHTSAALAKVIGGVFEREQVAVVEGGVEETQALLEQRFDHILFTGGGGIGRIVMAAAAKHLTPVTLELGGKSPCIVEKDADLDRAARRIAWGKFLNAGQTCVAPDYLLVHSSVKQPLTERIVKAIEKSFGKDPKASKDYSRIINAQHFKRLTGLIGNGPVITGGESDEEARYIAPTLIDNVGWDDAIMADEIFGPILPVIAYDDLDEAMEKIESRDKPLALYFFSKDRTLQAKVTERLSAGGITVNDTMAQFINLQLPFGGVGASGMGAYHGKAGFDTFSHAKPVVTRSTWPDPSVKYPPYRTPLAILKWVTRRSM
ncbi:MAG: aldehyde dehydrogenase [Salaquimonas sp.]|jgi:aldehyde dehydrogenase (NAD+)|nr:aldehyde dehydrogenase [Salaquimonas sp.]